MRNLSILTFLILFISLQQQGLAQVNTDSVLKALQVMPSDTNKIKALRITAQQLERTDSNMAKGLYYSSIALSKKLNNDKEAAIGYLTYGVFKINYNQYDSSAYYANMGLQAAEKANSEIDMAKAYNLLGNSYWRKSNHEAAIIQYQKAVTIFEKLNEHKRKALTLSNMCAVYADISDPTNGIKYGDAALAAAKKSGDADAIGRSLFNLGACYNLQGNEAKSIENYKAGLSYVKQSGIESFIQQGYYNIALNYLDIAKKTGALHADTKLYADSNLVMANKFNNPLHSFYANSVAGRVAVFENKLNDAENYYNTAFMHLQKDSSDLGFRTYYTNMAALRYAQGNHKAAYEMQLKRDVYNDAIMNNEKTAAIARNEVKFETDKKDAALQLQKQKIKQQNMVNLALVLGLLATGLLAFFAFRNIKNKRKLDLLKIENLENEKQLAATEAVLKGETQERARLAKDLHDGLGGMLSGIKYSFNNMKENLIMTPENASAFSRSMEMLDNGINEMRRVAHNMMPESLMRYGLHKTLQDYIADINKNGITHIEYNGIGIENVTLDNNTSVTVYRIIQELINNTMKHAQAKNMIVQLMKSDKGLVINVEDDGVGFDAAMVTTATTGIGWKNIKHRVALLNGNLQVHSAPGNGTQVNIEINN